MTEKMFNYLPWNEMLVVADVLGTAPFDTKVSELQQHTTQAIVVNKKKNNNNKSNNNEFDDAE